MSEMMEVVSTLASAGTGGSGFGVQFENLGVASLLQGVSGSCRLRTFQVNICHRLFNVVYIEGVLVLLVDKQGIPWTSSRFHR